MGYELEPWMGHATVPVMDIETAHQAMQKHRACGLLFCPLKQQAHTRLVEAGRLVPADWPPIYDDARQRH